MVPIRALQHYLYCPHRWGLLYIEDAWQDNAFTVKAGIVHKRVDEGGVLRSGSGLRSYGDVAVYDEEIGIQGGDVGDLDEMVRVRPAWGE